MLRTLLEGTTIRDLGQVKVLLLTLAFSLLLAIMVLRSWPVWARSLGAAAIVVLLLAGSQIAFESLLLAIPLAPPLLTLTSAGVCFFFIDFSLEAVE